jgi:hypothetical protein
MTHDAEIKYEFTSLEKGKRYYFRAYAKLSETVTTYSNIIGKAIPKIKVKTSNVVITGSTSAALEGEIEALGFDPITEHGFCWSVISSAPDFNSNRISLGSISETGEYSFSLNGLVTNQTYYFRAYAVENNIVYYGETMSFTLN